MTDLVTSFMDGTQSELMLLNDVQPELPPKKQRAAKTTKALNDPVWNRVCSHLADSGYGKSVVNNLQPKHCKEVSDRLPEGLWCEWFDRLLEEKRAHKPVGIFAKYNHPYKYTQDMVITAILRVEQRIAAELGADPFDDSPGQVEAAAPIFDGKSRGRFATLADYEG